MGPRGEGGRGTDGEEGVLSTTELYICVVWCFKNFFPQVGDSEKQEEGGGAAMEEDTKIVAKEGNKLKH